MSPTTENFSGSRQQNLWRAIVWTLRITVVLQCLGNWRWLTQIEETPLLHWMLDPTDIGGLAWSELTALDVQQVVGWFVLLAAGLVLWRPHAVVLVPLIVLQLLITVAMWRIADGYPLQAVWAPPPLLTLFPFATQIGRIAVPLGLLLIYRSSPEDPLGHKRAALTMQLLRWALAIVFFAHGIEAWQQSPRFLDLMINSTQRIFSLSMTESTARQCLTAIGGLDIAIAIACLGVRSLTVMWWMTLWGLATAASRLVANGWQMSWHETLSRIPHFSLPLAVVLWWHLLKYHRTADPKDEHQNPTGI